MDVVAFESRSDGQKGRRRGSLLFITLAALVIMVIGAIGQNSSAASGSAPLTPQGYGGCPGAYYTVVAGDFWSRIASMFKVSLNDLLAANSATTSTMIHPGDVVCLPSGAGTPTTAAGQTTTTAAVGQVVKIAQFPVQGPCYYSDTWHAPRSGGRLHEGVDIIAKTGQYIYAVTDGTLTKKYTDSPGSLGGNGWRLTRADGTYFFYAHMSAFAPGLAVGSKVTAGQIIGLVGMTGDAAVPHTHFEVHPGGGAAINPTPTVRAVDACKVTAVPPQPGGSVPGTAATTTTVKPTTTTVKPTTTTTVKPTTTTTVKATTTTSTTPTTAPTTAPPTSSSAAKEWQFIAPALALDTAGTKLVPGKVRTVTVNQLAGVPSNTPGVLVRLSARNVGGVGYLTVHPCDGAAVKTSTLNIRSGRVNAASAMVKVVNGTICVSASVPTDVKIEVVGVLATTGYGVQSISAKRAIDTRTGSPLLAGHTIGLLPKALGTPLGSKAANVTVTIVRPLSAGSLAIGPCGGTPWIVQFGAAVTQAFSAVVRTNDAGICVSSSVTTHVLVDVTGVWGSTKGFAPMGPTRTFDSRTSAAITPNGKTVALQGLSAGTSTVQLTITIVGGANGAAVFAWNCSQPRPTASVGVTEAGVNTSVAATLSLSGGAVCLASTAPVNVVVDVTAGG